MTARTPTEERALAAGFAPLLAPFRKACAEVRRTGETVVVSLAEGELTVTPELVRAMDERLAESKAVAS